MVLKFGHFAKYIKNSWEVLQCGAGEEWIRSVRPIVRGIKKYHKALIRRISYIEYREVRITGVVT